jgi:hypothetical protein
MPGDPRFKVLFGTSCVDILACWKFEPAQFADFQDDRFLQDKMDLICHHSESVMHRCCTTLRECLFSVCYIAM